jgi:peptidoglycan hydrolase-like protein with peptidoglycan-binding domain
MPTLKKGTRGNAVIELQQLLHREGWDGEADGIFGAATAAAVRDYQSRHGLVVDGIAGEQTLSTLRGHARTHDPKTLSMTDIEAAAKELGVDTACVLAVTEVEARKRGFHDPEKAWQDYREDLLQRCGPETTGKT